MDTCKWLSENMDDIIAYIPCYQGGNIVNAIKKDGQTVSIDRSIKWVINTLVKDGSLNIGYIRRMFREGVGATNLMPLPLSPKRVFIPVKVRKTIGVNDGSYAYIDFKYIKEVVKCEGTVISLECSTSLTCLESVKTVKSRITAGKLMVEKLLSLLNGECGSKEMVADYEKVATREDINRLAREIIKLREKIGKG